MIKYFCDRCGTEVERYHNSDFNKICLTEKEHFDIDFDYILCDSCFNFVKDYLKSLNK